MKKIKTRGGEFIVTGETITWANYFAIDADGEAWVYENRPTLTEECWFDFSYGRCQHIGTYKGDLSRWKEFLRDV